MKDLQAAHSPQQPSRRHGTLLFFIIEIYQLTTIGVLAPFYAAISFGGPGQFFTGRVRTVVQSPPQNSLLLVIQPAA
jgi:hypothetical protein